LLVLSLTLNGRKNKRTENDEKGLTLCRAKVRGGGTKALVSPLAKMLWGDESPRVLRLWS